MARRILILNGPNLNLLGTRETGIYGAQTLEEIGADCAAHARELGLEVDFRQSNHEGEMIDMIQAARATCAGIVINPAAYSHTSVGLQDALRAVKLPVIEVHLSNIHTREPFRHHSYVSAVADGVIVGLGPAGYRLALTGIAALV